MKQGDGTRELCSEEKMSVYASQGIIRLMRNSFGEFLAHQLPKSGNVIFLTAHTSCEYTTIWIAHCTALGGGRTHLVAGFAEAKRDEEGKSKGSFLSTYVKGRSTGSIFEKLSKAGKLHVDLDMVAYPNFQK